MHFSKPFQKVAVGDTSASTKRERERRARNSKKTSREGVCLCTLQGALEIAVRLGDIRMVLCITVTTAVPGVRQCCLTVSSSLLCTVVWLNIAEIQSCFFNPLQAHITHATQIHLSLPWPAAWK